MVGFVNDDVINSKAVLEITNPHISSEGEGYSYIGIPKGALIVGYNYDEQGNVDTTNVSNIIGDIIWNGVPFTLIMMSISGMQKYQENIMKGQYVSTSGSELTPFKGTVKADKLLQGTKTVVTSVNGVDADDNGNVTISTGGTFLPSQASSSDVLYSGQSFEYPTGGDANLEDYSITLSKPLTNYDYFTISAIMPREMLSEYYFTYNVQEFLELITNAKENSVDMIAIDGNSTNSFYLVGTDVTKLSHTVFIGTNSTIKIIGYKV